MSSSVRLFRIQFEALQFEDLRRRLVAARFPCATGEAPWSLGTDSSTLRPLLSRWATAYDWPSREAELNRWPQFLCQLDDVTLHFFHVRSANPQAVPILLTHGWPDSFLRYVKLFPLLREFHLVVPSLPGFAFSSLPSKGFLNNAEIAALWHRLMTRVLGYSHYVVSGGDVGRGVSHFLALAHPEAVRGIHLTDVGFARELMATPDEQCSEEELDYKHRAAEWIKKEGAYIQLQSTKPQTLAFALSDSPVALAAWLLEKYKSWSDWEQFPTDDLLDAFTLYWMTNSAATSLRVYHANTFTLPPLGMFRVPMAFTHFKYDVLPVPRRWIERCYPVVQYDEVPHGGHFTALEQPQAFAESLARFVRSL